MENQNRVIYIEKNIGGSLSLRLSNFFGNGDARWFRMRHNQKIMPIQMGFLLGMFFDPAVERMYRSGVFTISNRAKGRELFEKACEELGYEIPKSIASNDEMKSDQIEKLLKTGSAFQVKQMLDKAKNNDMMLGLIHSSAAKIVDDLTPNKVKLIEEATRLPL